MTKGQYPKPVLELLAELRRLPGIGPRSAERIAVWFLRKGKARAATLSAALQACDLEVRPCEVCGFFATQTKCSICSDPARNGDLFCVVEEATDVLSIERTGAFSGLYHVLGGKISPLEHVGPEDLRIDALLERVRGRGGVEVVLALGADVEGEATSHYLAASLHELGARVTRLAQGMPAGGGLEHADPLTLSRALAGRVVL